jgi:Bifunctional DNA primase/polymerase, N-terminal
MSNKPVLLQGALWHAAHEIPVLPLKPRNKVPLVRHGVKEGTTDAARIRKWWEQCPEANIGVPTGEASGLLVLDCDPRNGGPADRCGLIELFGSIPETAEAITGGGGRHIYFRYAGGRVPKTIAPGIDLKSDGGYVVVPPSIHPNGNPYRSRPSVSISAGNISFASVAAPRSTWDIRGSKSSTRRAPFSAIQGR